MARKKISKKTKSKVKKSFKKSPKLFITLFIILILIVGIGGYYLYMNGYLDDFLKPKVYEPVDYGVAEQSEEGYYYYTEIGFNEGEYYYDAKDLSGDDLIIELREIVNDGFNPVSYGDARHVLSFSDRDHLNNYESVRGMYDDDVIATHWIGQGTGAWQREHVWPNSKLGIPRVNNNSKNQGSDLHNLRAITSINQTRSNRYFADGSGEATTVGTQGFYPGDEHKGDVARILFYMMIKYDFLSLTNDVSLLENNSDTNYSLDGAYAGILDLLVQWHKEDPVDKFEVERNEFIYSGIAVDNNGNEIAPQGNRNPFIDKPELVHLIWEDIEIVDLLKPEDSEEIFSPNQFITHYLIYNKRNFIA